MLLGNMLPWQTACTHYRLNGQILGEGEVVLWASFYVLLDFHCKCCRLAPSTWEHTPVKDLDEWFFLPSPLSRSLLASPSFHLFILASGEFLFLTLLLSLSPHFLCRYYSFFSLFLPEFLFSYLPWMCPLGCIAGTSGTQLLGKSPPCWPSPQGPWDPIFTVSIIFSFFQFRTLLLSELESSRCSERSWAVDRLHPFDPQSFWGDLPHDA